MTEPLSLTVNTAEFNRWLNGVAREQIPFASAKALTLTAKDAQAALKSAAAGAMTLRNQHTARGLRIRPADKRDGMGMKAEVGSKDWYMADQAGEREEVRSPQSAKYRYIPKKARPSKTARIPKRMTPAAIAGNPNAFWRHKPDGTALVLERTGRGGKSLRLLHVAVPKQRLNPAMSLADIVQATASRRIRRNFVLSMQQAIKSAR